MREQRYDKIILGCMLVALASAIFTSYMPAYNSILTIVAAASGLMAAATYFYALYSNGQTTGKPEDNNDTLTNPKSDEMRPSDFHPPSDDATRLSPLQSAIQRQWAQLLEDLESRRPSERSNPSAVWIPYFYRRSILGWADPHHASLTQLYSVKKTSFPSTASTVSISTLKEPHTIHHTGPVVVQTGNVKITIQEDGKLIIEPGAKPRVSTQTDPERPAQEMTSWKRPYQSVH